MENLVFTQLSVLEVRNMLREEVRQAIKEFNLSVSKTDSESDLMNIAEVGKKLNMAVPSIYGLVHRRKIPFIKRGKKLIFEKSQIESWLKSGRQLTIFESNQKAEDFLIHKNHLEG